MEQLCIPTKFGKNYRWLISLYCLKLSFLNAASCDIMVVMQFNSFNPEMGWFFELAKLQCGYHFIRNVGDLPMIKKINYPVLTEMWNVLDLRFHLLICVVLCCQFTWFDKAADLNGICPDFCHYIVGLILSLVHIYSFKDILRSCSHQTNAC